MPNRRPIGDRHASSETHRRPTCLIGDPSETHWGPTCLIGEKYASSETHWRPTCLIGGVYQLSVFALSLQIYMPSFLNRVDTLYKEEETETSCIYCTVRYIEYLGEEEEGYIPPPLHWPN